MRILILFFIVSFFLLPTYAQDRDAAIKIFNTCATKQHTFAEYEKALGPIKGHHPVKRLERALAIGNCDNQYIAAQRRIANTYSGGGGGTAAVIGAGLIGAGLGSRFGYGFTQGLAGFPIYPYNLYSPFDYIPMPQQAPIYIPNIQTTSTHSSSILNQLPRPYGSEGLDPASTWALGHAEYTQYNQQRQLIPESQLNNFWKGYK